MHYSLADRSVEILVEHLCAGRHVRLQHLDAMGSQEFVDRILGILQIGENARLSRARLATGRRQSLRDAVIAESTLFSRICFRIQESAAVWTRLNAVPAAETIFLIYQHHTVGRGERSADRTHLRARR